VDSCGKLDPYVPSFPPSLVHFFLFPLSWLVSDFRISRGYQVEKWEEIHIILPDSAAAGVLLCSGHPALAQPAVLQDRTSLSRGIFLASEASSHLM